MNANLAADATDLESRIGAGHRHRWIPFAIRASAAVSLCLMAAAPAWAQDSTPSQPPPTTDAPPTADAAPSEDAGEIESTARRLGLGDAASKIGSPSEAGRAGLEDLSVPERDSGTGLDFIIAPIPFANPTLGVGLAGAAAVLYHLDPDDTDTPPSTTGIAAFASDNGSWGGGVVQKLYLFEDRHRVLVAAGYADVNYDFYGIGPDAGENGQFVPLDQSVGFGLGEWLTRVAPNLYLGPRIAFGEFSTALDREAPPGLEGLDSRALEATTASLGLRSEFDTRDNTFYPTRGTLLDFRADVFDEAWGSDFEYQAYSAAYNGYWSISDKQVVAFRAYGRGAAGDVPYFGLSFFGTGSDLRGYPAGVYQDRLMIATQAEYRLHFSRSWGVVAFAGVGQIAGEFNEFSASTDAMLPSIGAGIRYMLSQENRINFRVDFAVGKDESAIYLSVAEAF